MRGKVVIVAAALFAAALAAPAVREELQWRWIGGDAEPESYAGFLARWPQGRHSAEAVERQEEAVWRRAEREPVLLDDYVEAYPSGCHVAAARDRLDEILWQGVEHENTAVAFTRYLEKQPAGRFAGEAAARRSALLADDAVFLAAQSRGERAAFEKFLASFPGHRREADARTALADMAGRDIVDLIEEKKIEARSSGSGIEDVHLELRRRVAHPVEVRIPVGTYFASHNEGAQSMVTVEETAVTLASDDWQSVSVSVACADMPLDVPGEEDSFTIRRSPRERELQKLLPVLRQAGADYPVKQAAVWIVTDDASYDDLGTLVATYGFSPFGGTRMINAREAALAMKYCAEAGIPIRDQAIWWDRETILEELGDGEPELAAWLRGRG